MPDERTPLLQFPGLNSGTSENFGDHHSQFCHLVGARPFDLPPRSILHIQINSIPAPYGIAATKE